MDDMTTNDIDLRNKLRLTLIFGDMRFNLGDFDRDITIQRVKYLLTHYACEKSILSSVFVQVLADLIYHLLLTYKGCSTLYELYLAVENPKHNVTELAHTISSWVLKSPAVLKNLLVHEHTFMSDFGLAVVESRNINDADTRKYLFGNHDTAPIPLRQIFEWLLDLEPTTRATDAEDITPGTTETINTLFQQLMTFSHSETSELIGNCMNVIRKFSENWIAYLETPTNDTLHSAKYQLCLILINFKLLEMQFGEELMTRYNEMKIRHTNVEKAFDIVNELYIRVPQTKKALRSKCYTAINLVGKYKYPFSAPNRWFEIIESFDESVVHGSSEQSLLLNNLRSLLGELHSVVELNTNRMVCDIYNDVDFVHKFERPPGYFASIYADDVKEVEENIREMLDTITHLTRLINGVMEELDVVIKKRSLMTRESEEIVNVGS